MEKRYAKLEEKNNIIGGSDMEQGKTRRYRLDIWAKRNNDKILDMIKNYISTKYCPEAYDSRPAKEARNTFILLLQEECNLYQDGDHAFVDAGGVYYFRNHKLVLGECFFLISPYSYYYESEKAYLEFLYEMKWVVRERHLLDEPYEDPDDELKNGEKYFYFYGVNHEQLKAGFSDELASEREYNMHKLYNMQYPE